MHDPSLCISSVRHQRIHIVHLRAAPVHVSGACRMSHSRAEIVSHAQGRAGTLVLKERSLTSAGLTMTRASDSSLADTGRAARQTQCSV